MWHIKYSCIHHLISWTLIILEINHSKIFFWFSYAACDQKNMRVREGEEGGGGEKERRDRWGRRSVRKRGVYAGWRGGWRGISSIGQLPCVTCKWGEEHAPVGVSQFTAERGTRLADQTIAGVCGGARRTGWCHAASAQWIGPQDCGGDIGASSPNGTAPGPQRCIAWLADGAVGGG